jgi:hypothetical protein
MHVGPDGAACEAPSVQSTWPQAARLHPDSPHWAPIKEICARERKVRSAGGAQISLIGA